MEKDTNKQILRFVLTPQIAPRINTLFFTGFSFVAFFMAQIYYSARLLPHGHPYLNGSNMGKYGVRHVIAEAANNLTINSKHIDQIVIFVFMLVAMALLVMQLAVLGVSVLGGAAHAGLGPVPDTFAAYFLLPANTAINDVAFVMLDRVFGVPGLFLDSANVGTCVATNSPCFDLGFGRRVYENANDYYTSIAIDAQGVITPGGVAALPFPNAFHLALQDMFQAYSIGILFIATFIFIYFVIAIIAETAQSGTPFGKRFNHVWAPLRLVAAIGLLIPLTNGLNSGQYILLHAAKYGSGFASNGWNLFYSNAILLPVARGTPLGDLRTLVVEPNAPPVNTLLEFATILSVCKLGYERMYHARRNGANPLDRAQVRIDAYLVSPENLGAAPPLLTANTINQALDIFDHGDIHVTFGYFDPAEPDKFQQADGWVSPLCGKLTLRVPYAANPGVAAAPHPGADFILQFYYGLITAIWDDILLEDGMTAAGCAYPMNDAAIGPLLNAADGFKWFNFDRYTFAFNWDVNVDAVIDQTGLGGTNWFGCIGKNLINRYLPIWNDPTSPLPTSMQLELLRAGFQYFADGLSDASVLFTLASPIWAENMSALGWGGAAVWYNKVAEVNGATVAEAYQMPFVMKYPEIMETVKKQRAASDTDAPGKIRHQVSRGTDSPIALLDEEHYALGKSMYIAQTLWYEGIADQRVGGNIIIDAINSIFGTQGLFDMTDNHEQRVHPLAQLAGLGRSIMDSAINNLGYSAAAGLGGGVINMFGDHLGGRAMTMASGFIAQMATVGLTMGFVMFYIIPLLPFIYFFFAVGGWVKGIFEAMVGVPLWALAHLRIDGNGLPGDAAMGGYYLILEIFLRPILILFGFLASITIFSAQVQILHEIWSVVVSNASGFSMDASVNYDPNSTGATRHFRGAIDKLFYTAIYAIITYMLGMSAFKMIDLIPNHILRWMGASVSTFGDQSGDPAQNLVRNSFMGGNMISQPLGNAASAAQTLPSSGGGAVREIAGRQE